MELTSLKFIVGGILIVGLFCTGFAKPASDDDYGMQSDDDYVYPDDDENVSANHPKPSTPGGTMKSTIPPILEKKQYAKHIKPGQDAVLECPIKNLSSDNVILWLNGTQTISQMRQAFQSRLSVNENYTLTIHQATKNDTGEYYCKVLPQELQVHVKLHVSEEHLHPPEDSTKTQKHGSLTAPAGGNGSSSPSIHIFSILTLALLSILRI